MDIVERLRDAAVIDANYGKSIRLSLGYDDIKEAADEIEALRATLNEWVRFSETIEKLQVSPLPKERADETR